MEDSVKIWMDALATRSKSTKDTYMRYFKRFCDWSSKTPDELRELKFQEDQKEKPWERSEVENLLRGYIEHLKNKGFKTLFVPYSAVKSFFTCNGLPLNLNGGDAPINHSAQGSVVPTREDIQQIVASCEYLRDRAIILFLKDSGLRTSDLEGLKWGDLNAIGEGFLSFETVTRKRGVLARGFVGPETVKALELYKRKRLLGTRRIPAETDVMKHPVFSKITEGHVGIGSKTLTSRLSYIFCLAKMHEKGVSAHGLRKFWEQHVHGKKASYVKQLNGRALNRVEKAYDWLTREQLFDIYKKNYPNLKCLSPQQMIKQEDIERIVEQRVKERMQPLKEHFKKLFDEVPKAYEKANAEVNAEFEQRISQLEQLNREQIVKVARKLVEELIKSGELEIPQKPKK